MKKYCPSPATPTISMNGPVLLFILKYFPTGSSFGQKRVAIVLFTIATGGNPSLSVSLNFRPFRSGTCIVSRYEGLMQSYGITVGRSRAITRCPCTKTGVAACRRKGNGRNFERRRIPFRELRSFGYTPKLRTGGSTGLGYLQRRRWVPESRGPVDPAQRWEVAGWDSKQCWKRRTQCKPNPL